VYFTATWLLYPPSGQENVPSGPPVFPKFPADLLYPLYIPSAAHRVHPGPTQLALALLPPPARL